MLGFFLRSAFQSVGNGRVQRLELWGLGRRISWKKQVGHDQTFPEALQPLCPELSKPTTLNPKRRPSYRGFNN